MPKIIEEAKSEAEKSTTNPETEIGQLVDENQEVNIFVNIIAL